MGGGQQPAWITARNTRPSQVVENGEHICTMFPHAWANMVDRAELAGVAGSSHTWKVECGCAHCLLARQKWPWIVPEIPPRGLDFWKANARCRSQMLLLTEMGYEVCKKYGLFNVGVLPMDLVDPRLMKADYDCWPQDDFHNDSCTKGALINDVLAHLASKKDTGLYRQLEERFADSPREAQAQLKHFWDGVGKVTNANHDELTGIWRQLVCNVHLLIPGRDWLAMLAWGAASAWLRRPGPISMRDIEQFYELYHFALECLDNSQFNRQTTKGGHYKLQNLAWHDLVHSAQRILLWGKGFSTAFFEQMHELVLKRYARSTRAWHGWVTIC